MVFIRKTKLFLFLIIFSLNSWAESFRIHSLIPVTIYDQQLTEETINVGINDSVAIFLPDDFEYCEGIELQMQIPDAISQWRDSVVCSIYNNITPNPSNDKIDYDGARIFIATLPMRASWALQIPLKAENTIKTSAFAQKVNVLPNISKRFIFVRFQPAMKGIPDETLAANIKVSVKPILINKGKIDFKIIAPENKSYTIFVDDMQISDNIEEMLITPGQHTVSVISDNYRNETRTIRVDQAKTTTLAVTLKSIEPSLFVNAPENAEIFLDDELFYNAGKEIDITEGTHKIRFKTQSYEVTKEIFVQKGKTYTVSLFMDIQITEE